MNYDNTNKGQLWGNHKKESENQPDFRGSINIEGKEYWLSGWKRSPDANPKAPALKLSATSKEETHKKGYTNTKQTVQNDPFDQDVPF